jgi:hypothetical protein
MGNIVDHRVKFFSISTMIIDLAFYKICFQFNGTNNLKIVGTATGTKMAPCFYIYILYSLFTFMDKLEREFMDS